MKLTEQENAAFALQMLTAEGLSIPAPLAKNLASAQVWLESLANPGLKGIDKDAKNKV